MALENNLYHVRAMFPACPEVPDPVGLDEREACRQLFCALSEATGFRPQWGTLTGIRPVKLAGVDLGSEFLVSSEKVDIIRKIAELQSTLAPPPGKSFSLYISIPFCPSRCSYCSFISEHNPSPALVEEYVRCLCEEIRFVGEIVKRESMWPQTVYVGGGTPTFLSHTQLDRVLGYVREVFDMSACSEITVEAGRPDTVTAEKLEVLKAGGTKRVSINPQTFDDEVLKNIGRGHTVRQTLEALDMAKKCGFDVINCDLIAGLPGEGFDGFRKSVDTLLGAGVNNIAVHTLCVKRSSRIHEKSGKAVAYSKSEAGAMLDYAYGRLGHAGLRAGGLRPYYLYRQKLSLDGLENVGFASPGTECLYNVNIMADNQTIIACGAGGASKLVGSEIKRSFGYKYAAEYVRGFDEILRRKRNLDLKDCL